MKKKKEEEEEEEEEEEDDDEKIGISRVKKIALAETRRYL